MRLSGFKRFYGDGAMIGYAIGRAEAVTLIVDKLAGPWSDWCPCGSAACRTSMRRARSSTRWGRPTPGLN